MLKDVDLSFTHQSRLQESNPKWRCRFHSLEIPPGENTEQEENQRQGLGGPWTFQGWVDEEDPVDSTLEEPERQEVN